jgi:hypothetical protein
MATNDYWKMLDVFNWLCDKQSDDGKKRTVRPCYNVFFPVSKTPVMRMEMLGGRILLSNYGTWEFGYMLEVSGR